METVELKYCFNCSFDRNKYLSIGQLTPLKHSTLVQTLPYWKFQGRK